MPGLRNRSRDCNHYIRLGLLSNFS